MYIKRAENEFGRLRTLLNSLFEESGIRPHEMKSIIEGLSRDYISGRINISEERAALGYLLYFLPEHIPKIYFVLNEIRKRFKETFSQIEEIYDIGCGPGTGAICMRLIMQDKRPLVLIDRNRLMTGLANKLFEKTGEENIRYICSDFITSLRPSQKPALYIIMNTLSENTKNTNRIFNLVPEILKSGKPNLIIIIEPAGIRAREIMTELRKRFPLYIIAPCVSTDGCPLTENTQDICHFSIKQDISMLLETVINAGHRTAKFYYLVLSSSPVSRREGLARVLGYPSERRYGYDLKICSGNKIHNLRINIKNSSEKRIIKSIRPNDLLKTDTETLNTCTQPSSEKFQIVMSDSGELLLCKTP